jgi:hypothetical protein
MLKQKDIALIIVAVFIGAVLSIVVSKVVFGSPKNRSAKVEQVQAISPDFPTPSDKYFNHKSIDPTQSIHIGNQHNKTPFQASKGQ